MTAPTWPPGAASGIGSMPGTDVREAMRVVLGELPDLPHLPELPGRGPGADLLGRAAGAFLVDLHVDLQPSGWRLVERPGIDERRASDWLARDLDALEELAGDRPGPLKTQVAGPWTLAAGLETARGRAALTDSGVIRDLAQSLAEGVAAHVADLRRRVPGAEVAVQLDEPGLPTVLAGRLPTASGFGTLPPVRDADAEQVLATVLGAVAAAGAAPLVHSCAARVPVGLLVRAGAVAVSLDAATLTRHDDEALGEAVEAGARLLLGLVPTGRDPVRLRASDPAGTVAPARSLWRRLGLAPESLATAVVVTPACGLAGTGPDDARGALERARRAGRMLADDPEG